MAQERRLNATYSMQIVNYIMAKGWVPIPLEGKAPKIEGWTKLTQEQGYRKCIAKSKDILITAGGVQTEIIGNHFNVGVVCGINSGIFAIDVDAPKLQSNGTMSPDGRITWANLIKEHMPPILGMEETDPITAIRTFTARTGRNGYHYIFNYSGNGAKLTNRIGILPGIDIRTEDGGQIVFHGSIHPDTNQPYQILADNPVIDIPEWLYEVLNKANHTSPNNVRVQATAIVNQVIPPARGTTVTVDASVAQPNVTKTENKIDIEKVAKLLDILSPDYYNNYEPWIQVMFALKSIANESNNNQLLELWHVFSSKSEAKYNEASCNQAWNNYKERLEGPKTNIGSLYHWAKECDAIAYNNLFPKHNLTLNILTRYDPYDEYYLDDYLRWVEKQIFQNRQEAIIQMRSQLRRVARGICCSKPIYYFKVSPSNKFSPTTGPLKFIYQHFSARYKEVENDNEKIRFLHCMQPLMEDLELYDREVVWKPYHADQLNDLPPNTFNIFPGFKAKLVPFGPNEYELIKPVLTLIFEVWAKSDLELYKYWLSWISLPFRNLTKTEIVALLFGLPGAGKTTFLELLEIWVYGPELCGSGAGLDLITGNFNAILKDKMLYIVNEIAGSDHKLTRSQEQKFKDFVTNYKLPITLKGLDTIRLDNFLSFAISTNFDNAITIETGDRRFAVSDVDSKYVGNFRYFKEFRDNYFNQTIGNLLYSYFRSDYIKDLLVDIRIIPNTNAKQEMINNCLPRTVQFNNDFFDLGDHTIPEAYIHIVDNKPFIIVKDLYELYKDWLTRTHPTSSKRSTSQFSKEFKNNNGNNVEADRRSVAGVGREYGYFLNENLYDKVIIQRSINIRAPLRDLIPQSQ